MVLTSGLDKLNPEQLPAGLTFAKLMTPPWVSLVPLAVVAYVCNYKLLGSSMHCSAGAGKQFFFGVA